MASGSVGRDTSTVITIFRVAYVVQVGLRVTRADIRFGDASEISHHAAAQLCVWSRRKFIGCFPFGGVN